MATSNQIAARLVILLLLAAGAASCAGGGSKPRTDGGLDAASDMSKPDVGKADTGSADTGSDLPRPDATGDVVTTEVPPDLGPPDGVAPVDGSTLDQAQADIPTDSTIADASDAGSSNPDGAPVDAPPATGPGLVNPRTVPVTPSTPLAVAAGAMLPANNATGVPIDTLLRIGFDAAPTLGTSGMIQIHLAADGSIIDTINISDPYAIYTGGALTMNQTSSKVNLVGNLKGANVSQVRVVNYIPIFINGNTVTIVPHNNRLQYNTAYYVTIDNALIAGTISSTTFTGIAAPTAWTFTTKSAAPTTLNVAADDSADFATVQGAIDAIPVNNSASLTINIAPGVYQEVLFLRSKNNVTFKGSNNGFATVIQYDNADPFNPQVGQGQTVTGGTIPGYGANPTNLNLSPGGRPVFLISSSSGIVFDSITIKNLHAQGSLVAPTLPPSSQTFASYTPSAAAETIYFNGSSTNGTLVAKHSNFVSYQDTVQLKGFSWFYDSFITGDTDFIWGNANTALFERCEIKSRSNPNGSSVVNSRAILGNTGTTAVPPNNNMSFAGFVFLDSALTKETGTFTTFLARSPGAVVAPTTGPPFVYTGYDIVSFIGCTMDGHIPAVGWSATGQIGTTGANVRPNPVTGWREYHSMSPNGQLLDVSQRLPDSYPPDAGAPPAGSTQLSDNNVASFFPDRATILHGATDGTYTTTGLATFSPVP